MPYYHGAPRAKPVVPLFLLPLRPILHSAYWAIATTKADKNLSEEIYLMERIKKAGLFSPALFTGS